MPIISKEEFEELKRLREVEESVLVGLREEGFSEKAIELFRCRKNFLTEGDPFQKNADVIGSFAGSCGDQVDTYLKINKNMIEDAKYTTNGCPGVVTSASALTQFVKGNTLEEAGKLTMLDIVEFLKEGNKSLPKHDCITIAIRSLKDAIRRYEKKR